MWSTGNIFSYFKFQASVVGRKHAKGTKNWRMLCFLIAIRVHRFVSNKFLIKMVEQVMIQIVPGAKKTRNNHY